MKPVVDICLPSKFLERLEKKLLHFTGKAISDYKMIQAHDKILVCLSGGKDSWTLLYLLKRLQLRAKVPFEISSFTLDQGQPGFQDKALRDYLSTLKIPFDIIKQNTYKIVLDKIPQEKTYCGLCSRLRRGIIYRYAKEHGYTKIALGHHRDDLITSLLMSIFYNGSIASMPPKLLTDDKSHIVIRPLVYVQEKDIIPFSIQKQFPIIPCNLCGSQKNLARQKTGQLIQKLALENPKIPSNILHALQSVKLSQLMDKSLFDFLAMQSC